MCLKTAMKSIITESSATHSTSGPQNTEIKNYMLD